MSLGDELRRFRKLRGYSLREVESATGISNAYLSQLERSKASNPSPKVLRKIAGYYKVEYESLMAAAGYLTPEPSLDSGLGYKATNLIADQSVHHESTSPLQQAMLEADLSAEDEKLVADYIAFLQARNK